MGLINSIDDVYQEADIMCLLNNKGTEFIEVLRQMIESTYGEKENVWFLGNEHNITTHCGYGSRSMIRIDMLFRSENHTIPIELKKQANISALHQIEKYMAYLKEPMGVIVCKHATKKLKAEIKLGDYDNIWLWDLGEQKLY